jgi:glycosyltransferase involved in cell wall biosynthesis
MITIFTPSFADEADTNAQNLSAKEIVARLDPERAAITMLHQDAIDPRIASRPNTTLLQWRGRGNTLRTMAHILRNIPDVYFHPREGPLDAAFLSARRLLRLRTAVITPVVSGGLYNHPYSAARARNIRESDAVYANNSFLAELVREKMNVQADVIHSGIDRRYFFASELPRALHETPTVLYAGSFRSYKRVPLVVQQAARWPSIKFRLAGAGEEEPACRKLARELGCNNVEFLGHLSLPTLGEAMRQADIFLFPSVIEGHPQVLGQAAASGLPAIAMKSYRPDFVVDGVTGFLVETDDELVGKLDLLIRQAELRRTMGAAAAAHARKFEWDTIAKQWMDAFEHVVTERKKH